MLSTLYNNKHVVFIGFLFAALHLIKERRRRRSRRRRKINAISSVAYSTSVIFLLLSYFFTLHDTGIIRYSTAYKALAPLKTPLSKTHHTPQFTIAEKEHEGLYKLAYNNTRCKEYIV